MQIHTSGDKGKRNENRSGGVSTGFLYMIVIPRFRNGILKSTTLALAYVIVSPAAAMSAFCEINSKMRGQILDKGL